MPGDGGAHLGLCGEGALTHQECRSPFNDGLLATDVAHQCVGVNSPWWQAVHRVALVELIALSSPFPPRMTARKRRKA